MKQIITTSEAPQALGTYSPAVKTGNTVYISGQIAIDPASGKMVQGDFKSQARQVFRNLAALAKAAGGDLKHVVKLTIYLVDGKNFSLVNDIMAEFCNEPYPARATIVVAELPKQAAIEIEAIMTIGE